MVKLVDQKLSAHAKMSNANLDTITLPELMKVNARFKRMRENVSDLVSQVENHEHHEERRLVKNVFSLKLQFDLAERDVECMLQKARREHEEQERQR